MCAAVLDAFGTHPVRSKPMKEFNEWYKAARSSTSTWAHNFVLATVDNTGQPQARTVSLHTHDERGFVFCSNYQGPKAIQIEQNHKVSMVFAWEPLKKQVRINGTCEKIERFESKLLFDRCGTREKLYFFSSSQGHDHPFNQSNAYTDKDSFKEHLEDIRNKFGQGADVIIPMPESWGGFRVRPQSIEFLDISGPNGSGRMLYTRSQRNPDEWDMVYLAI